MLLNKMRERLAKEESGFTLIELLVVLVIIAVLLAIAVPSYLGFKERAEKRAAQSNVRAAIPAVEAFYSDHGDYQFVDAARLRTSYDSGLASSLTATPGANTYTLRDVQGDCTATMSGPGGSGSISVVCT
jgi:type IV pilus assembly protein PilA